MSLRRISIALGLLAVLAAWGIPRLRVASAVAAYHSGGAADTLSVSAASGRLPGYRIRRTGPREISVVFSAAPGEKTPPPPSVGRSKLVAGVRPTANGFDILLKTNAFSYVNSVNAGRSRLNIQIFQDDVGTLWTGPGTKSAAAPSRAKAAKRPEKPQRAANKRVRAVPKPSPRAAAESVPPKAIPPKAVAAKAVPPKAVPAKAAVRSPAGPPNASEGRPFFSVPYSMRARVNKTVIGLSPGASASRPSQPPAAATASPQAASPRAASPRAASPQKAAAPHATGKPSPAAPSSPAQGVPPTSSGKVDVMPVKPGGSVLFLAERHGPADALPAKVLSGRRVISRSEAASPTTNATTQPPAVKPPAVKPPAGKTLAEKTPVEKPPAGKSAKDAASAPAESAKTAKKGAEPTGNATRTAEAAAEKPDSAVVKQLKNALLKAQTAMVAGQYPAAAKSLEGLLRNPALKGDLREETLYSLADALFQQHQKDAAAHYEDVVTAQLAAMNANTKSPRVPKALVNLGMLDLKVGNIREAVAYFNILSQKYPHDEHAAMVPYALGEYFRNRGDLQKAADQYQKLIEKYPESRMSKETAYNLAQILRKLGQYDKAYQIVDFIDKRWPLFSMEVPAFLRLAGEVEGKVGKLDQAKDHFWTYYNIKPDDELADITLVRIGDIYLRQNHRKAAQEIYQKVIHDFPDREGALAARMRIAEAGVYDDPTMAQMNSVFGQPQSLKPSDTYKLIMTKYPQSPLAPLAELKLAMWQLYSKAPMDALRTASDFLVKYPKSPLADKARDLGFQAFLQALPQLVREGDYPRIMQLYDAAPFVKNSHDKIGDEAQMSIAVSAWKRGDPDRALKLAGRFLGKKQVPKYSEMALDLAMNIFVQRKEWKRVADLAARAGRLWRLSPRQKAQFEVARAMALENSGQTAQSLPLWTKIAANAKGDPSTRAQATYILAKDAARRHDMYRLFALSQEALRLLLANRGDPAKIKDCLLMSIAATERSGRYNEAVKWSGAFDRIIPPSDPDWAPVRLRLADLYRRGGRTAEWRSLLQEIIKKQPKTIYARMARQALESNALDQRLQTYLPKPKPQQPQPNQ